MPCWTLGRAARRKARRLALVEGPILFFCVVLCWQSVKICECSLATPSFHCIGGDSVPPPIACRTLGRAVHRKARRLALVEAPMQVFGVALCWQNVKICEYFLKMRGFHCIGGGNVPPPPNWWTLGQAMHQKARRLALVEAPILLCVSYCVNKTLKSVNVCLECPVFNALGAVVCRPQWLARRWAGQCAKRHVAWPWQRHQYKTWGPYRVGKMLKAVSVFLKCAVFNASGAEMSRPHRVAARWARRCTERHVAWPWRRGHCIFSVSYRVGKL